MSVMTKTIDELLGAIEKRASKQAQVDQSSIGGTSSHPSAKQDDGTESVPEGENAKKNTEEVKDYLGETSVDSFKQDSSTSEDHSIAIGMNPTYTSNDSSTNTSAAKGGHSDETSHPASTENADARQGKYGSYVALRKTAAESGKALLTEIAAAGATVPTQAKTAAQTATPPQAPAKTTPAAEAGEKLAKAAGAQQKQAEDALARMLGQDYIEGLQMAEKVAAVLDGLVAKTASTKVNATGRTEAARGPFNRQPKRAGDDADAAAAAAGAAAPTGGKDDKSKPSKKDEDEGGDDEGGESPEHEAAEGEGEGGGADGAMPSGDDLASMMAGGGDPAMAGGGAPPMDPAAGAPPMDAAMAGGDPAMAGGGAPPMDPAAGGDPAMAGGGGPSPEELHMLIAALAQAGVTPEQYQQALAQLSGGQLKAAASRFANVPYRPKTAKDKEVFNSVLSHVQEVLARSRG